MYRYISYSWMAVMVLLVQIFLLDNITIHIWLRPMIFPLIVLLLPMEWRTIWIMLVALAVALVMDISLGGAGLYTLTLLPLAVLRPSVMYLTTNRAVEHGDQTSLLSRLSSRQLMIYISSALLIYHAVFFMVEALSFANPLRLIMTTLCSTLLSVVVAWPIVRIFMSKVRGR